MVHYEVKEWIMNGWGWYPPIESIFNNAFRERKHCKTYIKFLIKFIKKLKTDGGLVTLMSYSGFSTEEKNDLYNSYNIIK
jgi:hypothetical protein